MRGSSTVSEELNQRVASRCAVAGWLDAGHPVPADLVVHADRTRLEQILCNLVDNAVKFNRPGGTVTISAEESGGYAVIRVRDTGAGIAAVDLPRVFERLYRADKFRSRKVEGTGLGLAIVKHLVQSHGGEVSVESVLGRGTTFTFTLPLDSLDADVAKSQELEINSK